jgi:hypothetical protein
MQPAQIADLARLRVPFRGLCNTLNTWSGTWDDPVVDVVDDEKVWIDYSVWWDPSEADYWDVRNYWRYGGAKIESPGHPTVQALIFESEKNYLSENRIQIKKTLLGDGTSGQITLGDDDFYNGERVGLGAAPDAFVQATNGTAVPIAAPQAAALELMNDIYSHGYVVFEAHPEHSDSYPFDLNTYYGSYGGMWGAVEDYDDKQDMTRTPSFWAACVTILFQPNIGHDWDPDNESVIGILTGGTTPNINDDVALIWNETVHEMTGGRPEVFQELLGMYTAHEIGHLYIRTFHSSGLMAAEPDLTDCGIIPGDLDLLRSETN